MWVTEFSEHGCRMSIYRVSESIPGLLRFIAKSEAYRQYCRYSVTFASFPVPGSVAESDQHGSAFLLLLDLDPHSECRSRSLKREKIHKNHLKVSTLVAGLYQYFYPMFRIRIRTDPHKEMPPGPDPDPYGHFWDPGSGSAWKLLRIRNTAFISFIYYSINMFTG